MVITRKLKLYLSEEQRDLFSETSERVRKCVNYWIDRIKEKESTKLRDLQPYYKEAREKFGLTSTLTQIAEFTAIRIARRRKAKRKTTPYLKKRFIGFNETNGQFRNKELKMSLGKGFMKLDYSGDEIPKGKVKESVVKEYNNEWYCYLSVDIDTPKSKRYKRTMGIDLGLAKIAVVADWNGRNTKFFGGSQLSRTKIHYEKLRAELQKSKDKGNVYKKLKRISQKERNWVRDMNHKIAREIVDMAVRNKRTIVLENLTGITQNLKVNRRTRKMLGNWSFRELSHFIKYKAELAGIAVVGVNPKETSKRCSKCGYISRYNRKTQERFKCRECGYETNADRNAAINIAQRGREVMVNP